MKTNNQTGRNFALCIGLYLIVKSILNMIIGNDPIGNLVYSVIEAAALYTGLMYINYVVAGIAVLVVLVNLKNNLSNIGSNWIYLVEAAVDVVCAVLLVTQNDIKSHFTNKWSELSDLFKK